MLKEKTGRRRTKQQVKADKEAAALKEKQMAETQQLLAGLGQDIASVKAKLDKAERDAGILERLVEQGVLIRGQGGQILPARR